MDLLTAENLSFAYPGQPPLWQDLNFTLPESSFTLLAGAGGSGKSTLLRHFLYKLEPHGSRSGEITFEGAALAKAAPSHLVSRIAFVMQNPDDQIISDSVWHELAFGLENQGVPPAQMHLRIAEIANFFGIQTWFTQKTSKLSGGQKQLLNLASVLVLKPKLLILDEPCAQLDPIAASEFAHILARVNRELGVTILITDHQQNLILPLADRVLLLEDRSITLFPSAKAYASHLLSPREDSPVATTLQSALPAAARISHAISPADLTLEIRDARDLLTAKIPPERRPLQSALPDQSWPEPEALVKLKNISFTYTKNGPLVLDNLSLDVPKGRFLAILGGNGSGKSTLLHTLAGLNRPLSGRLQWLDRKRPRTALLPQNPRLLFTSETIADELWQVWSELSESERQNPSYFKPDDLLSLLSLRDRQNHHPSDLSGGELQRAALAVTLLRGASLLLLDEPSKGLDSQDRLLLGRILKQLTARGITVLAVSHDLDFCAANADRCALLFQGNIAAVAEPHDFFSGHYFYTTDACRVAQGFLPGTITTEEVITAWQNLPEN